MSLKTDLEDDELLACNDELMQSKYNDERVIIHLDLDCFYAQVHEVLDPSLAGKPVGVKQKTILATTNYVARARGVGKMDSIKNALSICPELIIVNGEVLTPYRKASSAIFELIKRLLPACAVQRLGLDEFFVDVTAIVDDLMERHQVSSHDSSGTSVLEMSYEQLERKDWPEHIFEGPDVLQGSPAWLVQRLKAGSLLCAWLQGHVRNELHYACCGGIGTSKLAAKMAGELHKPNQQTCVFPCSTANLTGKQGLKRIPDMGHALRKQLEAAQLSSVEQIASTPLSTLEAVVGDKAARIVFRLVRGIDDTDVVATGLAKSMSNEDNVGHCTSLAALVPKIDALLHRLLARVEEEFEFYSRRPRTFRLAICGKRYRDRASRQEGLDNKIWTMSLAQQKEKLLERSVALLQKFNMSPFFVSVINVGVTSFEHVSQGAASIQQYLSAPSAKKKHIDDTTYVCTRCDVTLPAFCKDAHELFHQEDHSHINPI